MRAEKWNREETEIEGWAVKITSYQIGGSFITEVESKDSGATIARGVAKTSEASSQEALAAASRRLARTRRFDLMIGG